MFHTCAHHQSDIPTRVVADTIMSSLKEVGACLVMRKDGAMPSLVSSVRK
ncbi:hypothetical protein Tco_0554986, partial [Tanacetum coccineum]